MPDVGGETGGEKPCLNAGVGTALLGGATGGCLSCQGAFAGGPLKMLWP